MGFKTRRKFKVKKLNISRIIMILPKGAKLYHSGLIEEEQIYEIFCSTSIIWFEKQMPVHGCKRKYRLSRCIIDQREEKKRYEIILKNDIKLYTPLKVRLSGNDQIEYYNYPKNILPLDMKNSRVSRQEVIKDLKRQGFKGWISPITSPGTELEVCIFNISDIKITDVTLSSDMSISNKLTRAKKNLERLLNEYKELVE